ncbi:MAG: hypothetical protein WCK78_15385, partial [Paludibacter sp.]
FLLFHFIFRLVFPICDAINCFLPLQTTTNCISTSPSPSDLFRTSYIFSKGEGNRKNIFEGNRFVQRGNDIHY